MKIEIRWQKKPRLEIWWQKKNKKVRSRSIEINSCLKILFLKFMTHFEWSRYCFWLFWISIIIFIIRSTFFDVIEMGFSNMAQKISSPSGKILFANLASCGIYREIVKTFAFFCRKKSKKIKTEGNS